MAIGIAGLGVISPYGVGGGALLDGLLDGSTAPGTVDWRDVASALGGERRRGLGAETTLLLAASRLALADADLGDLHGVEVGIAVASRYAGLQDYAELFCAGLTGEIGAVNPARGPQTGLNAPAAHLSIRLGARGPNITMSNGTVGAFDALSYAADALRGGEVRTMLVGAVQAPPAIASVPATQRPAERSTPAARPFDRRRSGPLPGEATVVVVLEDDADASYRGRPMCAYLGAVASAFSPRGDLLEASRRSLDEALTRGCAGPVAAVFAGANGSVGGDAAEAQALHELIGEDVPVCAIKGALADSGAAGAMAQVAVAALGLERGITPPTVGFRCSDPLLPPLHITTSRQALESGSVLVHTWDEAGSSAAAVLHGSAQPAQRRAPADTTRRSAGDA